jgi:membrane protease YdiL (CAAX protease family)
MYRIPPPDDPNERDVPGEYALEDDQSDGRVPVAYRGATSDPIFGYLIAIALAIGLSPLLPGNADIRYTLVWMVLAGFGVLAWLFGTLTRIEQESPENLAWGIVFGLVLAAPLFLVGGSALSTATQLLFQAGTERGIQPLPPGVVLAYVVFVMPMAESLFFRGVIQERRPFWLVAILSTAWSLVLFAPMLNLTAYPGVAVLIGITLIMMNLLYGYVRDRNGLAAAWICQITVNVVVLFVPYMTR